MFHSGFIFLKYRRLTSFFKNDFRPSLLMISLLVFVGLLSACGSNNGSGPSAGSDLVDSELASGSGSASGSASVVGSEESKTGEVMVLLTDAPTDEFMSVFVTITEIMLLSDSGEPVSLFKGTRRVDLLALEAVEDLFMSRSDIPVGSYQKVRLIIQDPEFVKLDGSTVGSEQINLLANGKIDLVPEHPFIVSETVSLILRLDLDAKKSIQIVETGDHQFQFRPVIFVDVLHDVKDRFVSLQGHIVSVDAENRSFVLVRRERELFEKTEADHEQDDDDHGDDDDDDQGDDDDDEQDHDRNLEMVVFVSAETKISDPLGNTLGFEALSEKQFVVVQGKISLEKDLSQNLSIEASLIEVGQAVRLFGRITTGVQDVDADTTVGSFLFLPGEGQALSGEMRVDFDQTTLIVDATSSGIEVGPVALTLGKKVFLKGLVAGTSEAPSFKASLIRVKDKAQKEVFLKGLVSELDVEKQRFVLLSERASFPVALVQVTAETVLLRIAHNKQGASEIVELSFNTLKNGQSIAVFGSFPATSPFLTEGLEIGGVTFLGALQASLVILHGEEAFFETLAQGDSSKLESETFEVFTETPAWQAFWALHAGEDGAAIPPVNFEDNMVIVAHLGMRNTGGYGMEVSHVLDHDGTIAIHTMETIPGESCSVSSVITQPYHFISVNKTSSLPEFIHTVETGSCFSFPDSSFSRATNPTGAGSFP